MRQPAQIIKCDLCVKMFGGGGGRTATITCEAHHVDLCDLHVKEHFKRGSCLLVPAELAIQDPGQGPSGKQ